MVAKALPVFQSPARSCLQPAIAEDYYFSSTLQVRKAGWAQPWIAQNPFSNRAGELSIREKSG
jgi:hypothetical protein